MNILLCPDKFKGSLSAKEVCEALSKGLQSQNKDLAIVSLPLADGGDGSLDLLKNYLTLEPISVQTVNPLGKSIKAKYYTYKDIAFIELATASGLVLLADEDRNPMKTSTFGTGLMIKDALDKGFKTIYLFIGGSSTNDGGIGIAEALGFNFLDARGEALAPIGANLDKIAEIVDHQKYDFSKVRFEVLCDVTNPMHGPNGAAHVYAEQKNANAEEIVILDKGLKNLDECLKNQFQKDISEQPGMGAAGAVGASLVGLLQAELQSGFKMIADLTKLDEAIKKADVVITGEGKVDTTSFQGKVVGNVLDLCKKHNLACGIVGGMIEISDKEKSSFAFAESVISRAKNLNDAMLSPEKYLIEIGEEVGRLLDERNL